MEITTVLLFVISISGIYSNPISDSTSPYCFDYNFDDDSIYQKYLSEEMEKDPTFKKLWNNADLLDDTNDNHYTDNELRAIKTYTGNCVYKDFNAKTRDLTNGNIKYKNYQYKALHYYLSSAIEKSKACFSILYRGVTFKDTTSKVGDKSFMFKQFASSSRINKGTGPFTSLDGTLYKLISTCSGAYIAKYSCYSKEEEVLIPPCSKFTVTNITEETSSNPRSIELTMNKGDTFRKVTTMWFIITTWSFLIQF